VPVKKILIVDDDSLIRKITSDILEGENFQVFTAKNSIEGFDLLKREDIDVILLDIVMPFESGIEMIPKIREISPEAAIIIATAHASIDSAIDAIRLGAYDYIKKPVNRDELLHSIKNALERQGLIRENRALVENLEKRIKRLELFEKISRAISSTLALDELLEKVMDITKAIIGAEACSILLLDDATGELVFKVALGDKGDEVKEFRIRPGQGIAGCALERGEPILVSDATKDRRFFKDPDEKSGFRTKSIIAVPLFLKNKTVGVIETLNKADGNLFDSEDTEMLITMAGQIAVSIENAKMAEDLKKSRERIEEYSRNLENMVRKRTEQLEKANSDLMATQSQLLQTEKLSSIGQLAAGVAHEINNPIGFINSNLRTMGGYVEGILVLIDRYEAIIRTIKDKDYNALNAEFKEVAATKKAIAFDFIKEDIEKLIQESRDGTFRVYKIVRDLRDFSRADDAERKFFDIHRALDSTINIVWNEIKYKAEIVKDYGEIPEVECLPTQLNQVFMNLLINAAQSIEKKGKITIRTYDGDNKAFVEISDTGCGIPPENLGKLFDPFFTTKEPGKGTGLGLSISYNIIKNHKGELRVSSKLGEGTTFTVELPLKMDLQEGVLRQANS